MVQLGKASPKEAKQYSVIEEKLSSWSHAIGVVLGLVASVILFNKAWTHSSPWHPYIAILAVLLYVVGMLSSYIASTVYHALPPGSKKMYWRRFDHAAIYLHIAGTYAPFTLIALREQAYWGYGLFAFTWLSALVGVLFSLKPQKTHNYIETICYVVMGGAVLVAMRTLWDTLAIHHHLPAFWWLIGGGIAYVVGAGFYSIHKLQYMHAVFHVFVLLGSVCHILGIYTILS